MNQNDAERSSQQQFEQLLRRGRDISTSFTLEISSVGIEDIKNNFTAYVEGLKILWQEIHYVARQGSIGTTDELLEKIDEMYKNAWQLTAIIIQIYLENKCCPADLCIDSDWLISWLASNALLSKNLNEHYNLEPLNENSRNRTGKETNPHAKMRYLLHLSHHIDYVLHCAIYEIFDEDKKHEKTTRPPYPNITTDPTTSLSQSFLYIMSEYAYREIEIHREIQIFERLSRQLSYELPLYAASNFYRDHLYHVMDVCLLGELILRSLIPTDCKSDGYEYLAHSFHDQTLKDLLKNWYIAALCHDLGYVIEQSEKLLKPIEEIEGEGLSGFSVKLRDGLVEGKEEIHETIKNIVENNTYVIPHELATKLVDSKVSTDHGVAAWLHLRQWLKTIDEPLQTIAPALTAILRHNLSDQRFDIHKEPLTFLLLLCDHIQEWGRPRVKPESLVQGVMENLRFSKESGYDKKVRMNEILINGLAPRKIERKNTPKQTCEGCVCFQHSSSICKSHCLRVQTKVDKKKGLEIILPHVDASYADFEPCISWLLFCRDLQSISNWEKTFGFNMSIIFKHASPRTSIAFEWEPLEMDILEEYANRHSSATYLCEWIRFARKAQEGIKYECKSGSIETFTIHLHELGRPLRRGLSDEHWKDFFQWKWQWLRQKYIAQNLGPGFLGD